MNKNLNKQIVEGYEILIKTNLCIYFQRFHVLKNVYLPKNENLWIDRLTEEFIHFEANVKNYDSVDFKIEWTTYLAVMANQNLN
jgi:hypothetical protein